MTKAKDLFRKWKDDPDFIDEYEALEEEFALASTLIAARTRAAMTQQDVAARMETSQSYIAKLEELDTSEIEPTSHVVAMKTPFREDAVTNQPSTDDALANAPQRDDNFFVVPSIIE